jgi:FdhE protein
MSRQTPVALPEGYVEFYANLENWQNEQEIKLKKDYSPDNIEVRRLLVNSQKDLMKHHSFKIDPQQLKDTFLALVDFLQSNRPITADIIEILRKAADQLDFDNLAAILLDNDPTHFIEMAEDLGIASELLIFTADHALRPYLRMLAQPYYDQFNQDEIGFWSQAAFCPFCGSKSHFSRLREEDGKRFMFCDRCFTEWESRSIYCVHCGNDEPNTINYISVEDDSAYQIYTCEKCKGYLKTYDERQTGKTTDLFIANIETIYLDMLAHEKGYINHDAD